MMRMLSQNPELLALLLRRSGDGQVAGGDSDSEDEGEVECRVS